MRTNFNKRLMLSVGIIVLGIILAVVALTYLSNDLSANSAKFVSERAATQQSTADISQLAELEHDAPIAATYLTAMNTLLPTATKLIDVPPAVTAFATADGVVATFSFEGNPPESDSGSFGTVPFSLDVQGPLNRITAFLADIETKTTGFLINLNSFDLVNSATGNAHLAGNGLVYFQ